MLTPSKEEFWIYVVDGAGKGLQDVRVTITQLGKLGPYAKGSPTIQGLTNTDGWFGIKCNYSFKAEVFLDNKSYGVYWCENGAGVSIKV
ncbi:MAG: hypothetical protein AAB394_01940 [Patescibacteria group bacterium]